MPSTSRNLASASGEGQVRPVGTLFALARNAVAWLRGCTRELDVRGTTKATRHSSVKPTRAALKGRSTERDLVMMPTLLTRAQNYLNPNG
mmetsp:Transcript_118998/g.348476  ORF Transcript_118998/g.348476 Transcript_118998/m.348476 type:complete len:90 (+) Transcript_118998:17-286(+)